MVMHCGSVVWLRDRTGSCSINGVTALTGSLFDVCFGARFADVLVQLLGGLLCDADAFGVEPGEGGMLIVKLVSS